ncbi:MAG: two component transcriptional regulator, LuxR family [Thermoleophilia bacterium]|nr:two component transcriptional regulator, LuxR family [Thermoleophilia bacterium]
MNTTNLRHQANVVIVHELPLMRRALRAALATDARLRIVGSTAFDAIGISLALDRRPDAILIDPAGDADTRVATVEALHHAAPTAAIIVMLSHDVVVDVGALRGAGATSFIDCYAHSDEVLAAVSSWCNRLLKSHRESGQEAGTRRPWNGSPDSGRLETIDLDLLQLVAEGHTDEQIAQRLYISSRTVQKHLARLRTATACANRPQLVAWYMRSVTTHAHG